MQSSVKLVCTLTFLLSLIFVVPNSASDPIDSLLRALSTATTGADSIDLHIELAKSYYSGGLAMEHSMNALDIARRTGDRKLQAKAYRQVGWSYYADLSISQANIYLDSALSLVQGTGNYGELEEIYNVKAVICMDYRKYECSNEYFRLSYEMCLRSGDKKRLSRTLNNWGVSIFESGDPESALEKHKESLELNRYFQDDYYKSRSYQNIAQTLYSLDRKEEALENVLRAIAIRKVIKMHSGTAESLLLLADILNSLKMEDGPEGKKLMDKLGLKDPLDLIDSVFVLPDISYNSGVVLLARKYRADILFKRADYEAAYRAQQSYQSYKDSLILSEENLKGFASLKTGYEKQLIEKELSIRELELSRSKTHRAILIAGIFILIGFVISYYFSTKNKRKLESAMMQLEIEESKRTIEDLKFKITNLFDEDKLDINNLQLHQLNKVLTNPLTEKEFEILICVYRGMTNPDISSEMFISENTVKYHIKNIFSKLDINKRRQLSSILKSVITKELP